MSAPIVVKFGSEICGSLDVGNEREWLATNGLGGFASGTVTGVQTRRYHGLLIASLPERGRVLLVSKAEEILRYAGRDYALGANRWSTGTVEPKGFLFIEQFRLSGSVPVWRFACADAIFEKRVWMQDGANTTFIRYELVYASRPTELEVKILVNYRDIHATTQAGNWETSVTPVPGGLCVVARDGANPVYLLSDTAQAEPRREWYRNYDLAAERERGLDHREDHLLAAVFKARLTPGGSVTLAFSTDPKPQSENRAAIAAREDLDQKLLEYWIAAHPRAALEAPHWIWQLVLAAAQFAVRRRTSDGRERWSIVAGYPWFGEWGRDAMIALPGLALETGRPEIARSVLHEFPRFAQQGLLPNTFSETRRARQLQQRGFDALVLPGSAGICRPDFGPERRSRGFRSACRRYRLVCARDAIWRSRGSCRRFALRGRARNAGYVDGRKSWRSPDYPAYRKARGDQRALVQCPSYDGAIRPGIGKTGRRI